MDHLMQMVFLTWGMQLINCLYCSQILKDVIIRQKILEGKKVNYIPGWDCHGLPIELKAIKNQNSVTDPLEIRNKARKYAQQAIEDQKKIFQSWGILGDWNNIYTTFSKDYIINQFRQFYELYSKNLIFRDTKPIHWSPSSKTALAESELEYNENHQSSSIYVRFKIENFPKLGMSIDKPIYALVWTTTPWTLPSNQSVCYSPKLTYCLCTTDSGNTIFIAAVERLEELKITLNCNIELLQILPDGILSGAEYRHPIYKDKILPFLPASHVSSDKGTGLVHTAPAHGPEDFLVALENNLSIVDLVNEEGSYKKEAGPDLEGKFVLEEGNQTVIQKLDEDLVNHSKITHSYPYDWRTKKPVIIKASQQWFLNTNAVKDKALEHVSKLTFIPNVRSSVFREEFRKQIGKRPFWCISRQRTWGVPIPVFFHQKTNEIIFNQDIIDYQCKLLEENGTDYWWMLNEEKLLPENLRKNINISEIRKSEDILDIWFDSGISWSQVIGGDKIADLYLEGNDQLNGWFYSSLITSLACRNEPPCKSIYIHGFAVDEKGLKMSKSQGNVVDPIDIVNGKKGQKPYGIDVLRWWVSCHANNAAQINVSDNVLQVCSKEVQKIRSVLRFILGALNEYEEADQEYSDLLFLDKYILHLLHDFYHEFKSHAEEYAFNKIGKSVVNLLTNEISGLYYPAIKDRLYCEAPNNSARIAAQYTLKQILDVISLSVAPMLPHLIEEIYMNSTTKKGESFFKTHHKGINCDWKNDEVKEIMDIVLDIKKNFNLQLGSASSSMDVNIKLSTELFERIQKMNTLEQWKYELSIILLCASVNISKKEDLVKDYHLEVAKSGNYSCPRCRRMQSTIKDDLCLRCSQVVDTLQNKEYSAV
ncbi:isoleucine--tRNA ligase, mitochondrial isoform X2 [Coccinella septempunctata]|uniref:isoleucine--tRNA ligase, mitochondrial isoform X2 n=1 Tax=Coccinella septempunctata TaxID=41139 RepID=UPI001D062F1A|nr:isoleucine--tRNA ligase, mitochondrial isoform X2 [Coccinella septempunctata]